VGAKGGEIAGGPEEGGADVFAAMDEGAVAGDEGFDLEGGEVAEGGFEEAGVAVVGDGGEVGDSAVTADEGATADHVGAGFTAGDGGDEADESNFLGNSVCRDHNVRATELCGWATSLKFSQSKCKTMGGAGLGAAFAIRTSVLSDIALRRY
jgi:hypothetical protein